MADDAQFAHDPKFRQFSTAVEKALRSFESTSEWADLISALGKLSKVLQTHTKFPALPKKYTVGKRLSQCTHPALPSGCHLKALEVYDLIFTRIGNSGLARDIFVYASGLFPLLGCSAMSVRPPLLSIYETHFLPLGHHLSPALQGLLLALLPGLEEGSEHTQRIQLLLVSLCNVTDRWLFYNALWTSVLTVPSARLPALVFVQSQLTKGATPEDQQHFFGDDLLTMVKGLRAALTDSIVLVQRSALDVLVALLPLHQEFLPRADTVKLLESALSTLLRRDMSLSRRFFSWILGQQGKSTDSLSRKKEYFLRYSRPIVVQGLRSMLLDCAQEDCKKSRSDMQSMRMEMVQPIRILVTLLDKEDIGQQIIDEILLDVVRALYTVCQPLQDEASGSDIVDGNLFSPQLSSRMQVNSKGLDELRLQAQTFFEQLNPVLLWQHFATCFSQLEACQGTLETSSRHHSRRPSSDSHKSSDAAGGTSEDASPACSFDELVDLASFMLAFMPLELILDLKEGTLHIVFCHCLRAVRCHYQTWAIPTIRKAVVLCSQLLARSPLAGKCISPPTQLWPDVPVTVAPRLSCQYLAKALDSDGTPPEERKQEDILSNQMQLVEVCRHYAQSFFALLASRCRGSTCQAFNDSSDTLSELKSIVSQSLGSGGRLVTSICDFDSDDERRDADCTFDAACHLLVQLSSCQMPCTCQTVSPASGIAQAKLSLSPWLLSLIASTTSSPSYGIASSAVQCLLQLCEASQVPHSHADTSGSEACATTDESSDSAGIEDQNIGSFHFVVMANEKELGILHRASYFEALAVLLWRELGHSPVQQQQRLAELLCQLNGSPLAQGVLERVICSDFSSSDPVTSLSAHKRFSLLWHLSFEEEFTTDSPHLARGKLFLRPLNLMLDGLTSRHSWCRALAHSWLEQVLSARDLHRLLQPLVLALLKPNSARVMRVLSCPSPPQEKSTLTYSCLVYVRPHDTAVSVYAMKSLLNVVRAQPHLFVTQTASCQLPQGSLSPGIASLGELLSRHEVSISGGVFENSLTKAMAARRNYFEVLLTVLSWTMVSTFADAASQSTETLEQLELLQVTSVELLTALFRACNLVLQQEQTSSSASYIRTLLQICVFHRYYLLCLTKSMVPTILKKPHGLLEEGSSSPAISASQKAFQSLLLEMAEVVIELEGRCDEIVGKDATSMTGNEVGPVHALYECKAVDLLSNVQNSTIAVYRLALQPVFQVAVAHALDCHYLTSVHCQWLSMLNRSVGWLGPALGPLITTAVTRVSKWLLYLASVRSNSDAQEIEALLADVPPLYLPSVLRGFSSLLHYALLGIKPVEVYSNPVTPSTSSTSITPMSTNTPSSPTSTSWHLILPFGSSSHTQPAKDDFQLAEHLQPVRDGILQNLPNIVQALLDVWSVWRLSSSQKVEIQAYFPAMWGSVEQVSRQAISLLHPIGMQYSSQLLASIAEVWLREQKGQSILQLNTPSLISSFNQKQDQILSLLCELPCLSCEVLFTIARQLLSNKDMTAPQEECFFHLLVHRVARASPQELQKCWPLLNALLKDGFASFSSNPPRLFLSIVLLVVYLRRTPQLTDRKLKREVQDTSQRCLDACTNVVGASLENTAWLRRSMAITASHIPPSSSSDSVSAMSSLDVPASGSIDGTEENGSSDAGSAQPSETILPSPVSDASADYVVISSETNQAAPLMTDKGKAGDVKQLPDGQPSASKGIKAATKLIAVYSPQALQCLSSVIASFVDMVYGSEDKERAVAILSNMMVYVLPFLKTHSSQNLLSSTAAIHFLSSISEFHYTRRAWRREITDIFFDPEFFHFDSSQLSSWCSIVDNLLGHDKQARRDLLARVSISQSGLNLFTNSDLEMQQRTHLLKRLSFAIYSSPVDQYEPLLPDIQERLAECLRIQMAPTVHHQVFFCWRVLLVRMSATNLTAFWPVMMTELTQVLLQLEQDLIVDATKLVRRQSTPSTQQTSDPWVGLYLSACKLLDLVLALPPSSLPQFQMYQWAFVGAQRRRRRIVAENAMSVVGPPDFEPYMVRMVDLLDQAGIPECEPLQQPPGRPLLSQTSIASLLDLKPFILGLVKAHYRATSSHSSQCQQPTDGMSASQYVESLIAQDFLESGN